MLMVLSSSYQWPTLISGWLSAWPGKMEPFTSGHQIGLRNKPQLKEDQLTVGSEGVPGTDPEINKGGWLGYSLGFRLYLSYTYCEHYDSSKI